MPPANAKQLGQVLRQTREDRELTLRELAERAGVAPATILRLEDGTTKTPRGAVLERLAPHLGLRVADLYALAGISMPALAPYMRVRYGLPEDAVSELESHIEELRQRYGIKPRRGGRDGNKSR
jgi:transcriptional regulator with XRE-family HTH domain